MRTVLLGMPRDTVRGINSLAAWKAFVREFSAVDYLKCLGSVLLHP
jgi:hypothetical protein